MPVDFLSDGEAARYGRYCGPPSQVELEKVFFLDDADKKLVKACRGPQNRLGYALQLTTVRYVGRFLADPLDGVPTEVLDYLAEQLGIFDASCVKSYAQREGTHREHAGKIQKVCRLRDFAEGEVELVSVLAAHAWNSGDGPTALFQWAVRWLREHDVLLPGITTLTRLVARERDAATQRLYVSLAAAPTPQEVQELELLLEVPAGRRESTLERWRTGPSKASGPGMVKALGLVEEILSSGLGRVELDPAVPARRLVDLARYGLGARSAHLKRHPDERRIATLVAAVRRLETKTIDDALELLDLLMVTELLGKAHREADKQKVKRHPKLAKASARLAVAVEVLLEATEWGDDVRLFEVWEMIEARVPRAQLRDAVETITDMVAPPEADDDGGWRAEMATRYPTVSGFVKVLTEAITFEAGPEGSRVLAAMKTLPVALAHKPREHSASLLPVRFIDDQVVVGVWKRLVYGHPARKDGLADRNAYVFCVLEQFHRRLKRREIHAPASSRWRDPNAQLLEGAKWAAVKDSVLTDLGLPADPGEHLTELEEVLDRSYRVVRAGLAANTSVSIDDAGKIHVASVKAIEEPLSLIELRTRIQAMMPRVDISEAILEVLSWCPEFLASLTSLSGGSSQLEDLDISVAACLTAQALNITYTPIAVKGVPALERHRLGHVDHTYLRAENYAAGNPHLIAHQAKIGFAQALGGGLVAAIDGMRFIVPVPSAYARPNRKYFGPKRGVTWLNMINDQAFGVAAKVVSGTDRDCLHALDIIFSSGEGRRADVIVTDTGSYSDLVFGLAHLLDRQYRPALADLPDQKLWKTQPEADYGALNSLARGRLDLAKVAHHWQDIIRLVASIYTSEVSPYDVVRMLQRDGHPTALGEAINTYGRLFKSLHVLALIDDEDLRRDIKGIRNLQEGRHALAERVFHGRKGQLFHRYYDGLEDQLGALGIVLNCLVLWNTTYIDDALTQLREQGYLVQEADVARLSPFICQHINVHGRYSFSRHELGGARRPLRDPETPDPDAEDEQDVQASDLAGSR